MRSAQPWPFSCPPLLELDHGVVQVWSPAEAYTECNRTDIGQVRHGSQLQSPLWRPPAAAVRLTRVAGVRADVQRDDPAVRRWPDGALWHYLVPGTCCTFSLFRDANRLPHCVLQGSRRRDCHSAAPPSIFSRCINSDGKRERQQNDSLVHGYLQGEANTESAASAAQYR